MSLKAFWLTARLVCRQSQRSTIIPYGYLNFSNKLHISTDGVTIHTRRAQGLRMPFHHEILKTHDGKPDMRSVAASRAGTLLETSTKPLGSGLRSHPATRSRLAVALHRSPGRGEQRRANVGSATTDHWSPATRVLQRLSQSVVAPTVSRHSTGGTGATDIDRNRIARATRKVLQFTPLLRFHISTQPSARLGTSVPWERVCQGLTRRSSHRDGGKPRVRSRS